MKNCLAIAAIAVSSLFSLAGCRTDGTASTKDDEVQGEQADQSEAAAVESGFDADGKARSCAPRNEVCTQQFTANDQFAADCKSVGAKATSCGCHDHICSKNIHGGGDGGDRAQKGFDINGKPRTCTPAAADTICTQQFTAGDKFGEDCKAAGGTATACGCHDNVCSIKLVAGKVSGFSSTGQAKSCKPMDVTKFACTQQFTLEDGFANSCRQRGGVATACACHNFVCSIK